MQRCAILMRMTQLECLRYQTITLHFVVPAYKCYHFFGCRYWFADLIIFDY